MDSLAHLPDPYRTESVFWIADICDVDAGAIIKRGRTSCEQLKELDYINNPPTECDTISLFDPITGWTKTGVYIEHVLSPNCN